MRFCDRTRDMQTLSLLLAAAWWLGTADGLSRPQPPLLPPSAPLALPSLPGAVSTTSISSLPAVTIRYALSSPPTPLSLPQPYSATISADFTVFGTYAALQTILSGDWDEELLVAFVDTATAYFSSPKDVTFTWTWHPEKNSTNLEPPDFIRLSATTRSASSTAILEQNFTDLTVGTFNSLLSQALQGSSLPVGSGDIWATSISSPPIVTAPPAPPPSPPSPPSLPPPSLPYSANVSVDFTVSPPGTLGALLVVFSFLENVDVMVKFVDAATA